MLVQSSINDFSDVQVLVGILHYILFFLIEKKKFYVDFKAFWFQNYTFILRNLYVFIAFKMWNASE